MSDKYVTLLGTEQVQSAANTMKEAANEMRRAANTIHEALRTHEDVMRQLIEELGRGKL
jgi:hypothetical protein